MANYKCAECDSDQIGDADCPACEGMLEDDEGNECAECDGTGYFDGYLQCLDCGVVEDASMFEQSDV